MEYQLPAIGHVPSNYFKYILSDRVVNGSINYVILKDIASVSEEVFEKSQIHDSAIKECVHSNYCSYADKAEYISLVLTKIQKIVNFPLKNSFPKEIVEAGFEEDKNIFMDTNDINNPLSFAYKFILKNENFNGDCLNVEIFNRKFNKLSQKMLDSNVAACLFQDIERLTNFEKQPLVAYEEWRKSTFKLSGSLDVGTLKFLRIEEKIYKRMNSITEDGCFTTPNIFPKMT